MVPIQLILFFSKSLLRHPKARSELTEMIGDTCFQRYIPDPHPDSLVSPTEIRRHIICTGKAEARPTRINDSKFAQGKFITLYYKNVKRKESKMSQSADWSNFRPSLTIL